MGSQFCADHKKYTKGCEECKKKNRQYRDDNFKLLPGAKHRGGYSRPKPEPYVEIEDEKEDPEREMWRKMREIAEKYENNTYRRFNR